MTASESVYWWLQLLRLADEPEDRRDVVDDLVEPVVEQILDEVDDGDQLMRVGRMLAHVAGRPQPADRAAERLAASPPHARGFVLDAFDDLNHTFTRRPRPVRWA